MASHEYYSKLQWPDRGHPQEGGQGLGPGPQAFYVHLEASHLKKSGNIGLKIGICPRPRKF